MQDTFCISQESIDENPTSGPLKKNFFFKFVQYVMLLLLQFGVAFCDYSGCALKATMGHLKLYVNRSQSADIY